MRIGLVVGDLGENIGGGTVFERSIINALQRHQNESPHIFYAISIQKQTHSSIEEPQTDRIGNIILARSRRETEPKGLLQKGFRRLSKKIRSLETSKAPQKGQISRELGAYKLDLLWHIGAYTENLDPDIPYFTTVWDLQHRLQPYFPEIAATQEWNQRERYWNKRLKRSACVIVTGKELKRQVELFYNVDPDRIICLPQPIPDDVFNLKTEQALSASVAAFLEKNSTPFIFYPAQFWSHKNHVCLLDSLKLASDNPDLPNFDLVFTGADQGNLRRVQNLVETMGLQKRVHFLGFVSRGDILALYQKALALGFPSFFGPDNIPPLEASALECPVLTADVPGAREQLGDSVLYFLPDQPESFNQALHKLISKPEETKSRIGTAKKRALGWTPDDYVQTIFPHLDRFEKVVRTWSADML